MSLRVWLPLTGDFHNQGLDPELTFTTSGTVVDANGKIGICKQFQNNASYAIANYNFTLGDEASIALWVYFDGDLPTGSTDKWIIDLASTSGYSKSTLGIAMRGSKLVLCATGKYDLSALDHGFVTGKWYHVCYVWANTKAKIYINGVLKHTYTNLTKASSYTSSTKLSLAGNAAGSTSSLMPSGRMNDIRVYDHALSQKEIKEISKGLFLHHPLYSELNNFNLIPDDAYTTIVWTDSNTNLTYVYDEQKQKDVMKFNIYGLYRQTISVNTFDLFNKYDYSPNTQYTVSFDMKEIRTDGKSSAMRIIFVYTDGTYTTFNVSTISTETWTSLRTTSSLGKTVARIRASYGNSGYVLADNFKLAEATLYDCSGYEYNGTSTLVHFSDISSKYNKASVFEGTNYWCRVNSTDWMINGATQLTINFWAKAAIWTANGGRLLSCTETGGFNLEGGNSGYWRFPIHVYTNSEQTSTAYMYDSNDIKISDLPVNEWIMFTLIYTTSGTKTYINGLLNNEYIHESYGIHYNKNARLFLGCEANVASATTPYFIGEMSDFRMYATALSADDISELYHTGQSIDKDGNLYAYDFYEDDALNISLKKNGVITAKEFDNQNNLTSFYKTGEIYTNELKEI